MPLNSTQNTSYGKDLEVDLDAVDTQPEQYAPLDQSWGYSDPSGNETVDNLPGDGNHSTATSPPFPIVRRVSLDEVNLAVNQDHSHHIQNEFGRANQPGGKFSIIPLETMIQVNYCWDIDLGTLQDEKLVSLPFGPKNWMWQLIVYPHGVGDAAGEYLSCFLRTVKNDTEIVSDRWSRPISHFGVKVKQPSVQVGVVDYDPTTFLEQYSEPEFTEFSESTQGWGFHEFCQLPFPQSQVIFDGQKVRFEIEILGSMTVDTSTMNFDEVVPISTITNQQLVTTSVFGPEDCRWQVQFGAFTDQDGNLTHISAHMQPVHSTFETALGGNWDRKISTLCLKLIHPITNETLASKCLTGTFIFTESNPLAGWNDFMALDNLYSFQTESALVRVEVTWDPELLLEHTKLGKAKLALSSSGNLSKLKDDNARLTENTKNLNDTIRKLTSKIKNLESKSTKQEFAKEEVDELRNRLALVTQELLELRKTQEKYYVSQVRFSTVKEKLAGLRKTLDGEYSSHFDSPSEGDHANELKECRSELAHVYHEKAQLELQLAQATSELQFIQRSAKDGALLEPIASHEDLMPVDLDPLERIEQAIEMSKNEIKASTVSLDEVNNTIADNSLKSMSAVIRAGLIADMSMVQCGLDVANATLHEAAEHLHLLQDVSEFLQVQKDLKEIRLQFSQTKFSLEDFSVRRSSEALLIKTAAPPYPLSPYGSLNNLSPPPIGVPHNSNKKKKSTAPQFNELEHHNELKEISSRIGNLADLLKTTVVPVANPSRPFRPQDIQPWAPKERGGALDLKTLTRMLNDVSNRHRSGGVFSYFVITTLLSFFVYSTIFVVCNPEISSPVFDSYSEICDSFVLPVYHETRNYWHKASEKITLDVLPFYGNRVATRAKLVKELAKGSIVHTFNKAIKQGSGVAIVPEKIVDPIHPLDPEAPKTSSTGSVEPLPDSTTLVSKLNHPNTAPGNRKARPIVDAEEIMKHANDKIAIEKTFPTVKPKNVQPTTPVVVDGAVDPVNSKISSIGSVEPLPDSTTLVSKLNHPSTASANRNAGPIIDGEDIMKHANEKIAIDKTFPTVKPKNVQPTIVAEVESADISSAEAAKSVIIESSNAKPIITVAPRAQESNVTPKKPSDEVLATENSDLVENGEEITQVDEALKSVVTGSSSSSTDDSTEFVDNKPNVEVITESVEVDYSVEKNAETNTQPDFEELTVAEPTTDSIANSRQEETSQTINSEIQLDDLTSIPSEEISAPIEQEIIPEAVSASTVSETTVDGTLSPTPSVVDELNEANVNYEPTETFSSSPPTADHVTLRDDKDSFDKGEEVVRDEL